MTKVKIFWYLNVDIEVDYDKNVELWIDNYPSTPIPENTVRMCLSLEPHPHISVKAFFHPEYYDYLLTWKQEHLDNISKAVFFHGLSDWCGDYIPIKKQFGVSTVVGSKNEFQGHSMRQALYFRQEEITIPTKFYLSGNKEWKAIKYTNQPLLDSHSKNKLWETQFHIAIENLQATNWFTEKILDCFLTRTIPVYIGAPNIASYFNTEGMIICEDVDDLINKCNKLNPFLYRSLREPMEDNFIRAQEWTPWHELLRDKINSILQEHDKHST